MESFAVDVGGTFTDLVVLDQNSGQVRHAKALTTPLQPADGLFAAIADANLDIAAVETFFHGTTLGLNSLLERRIDSTGLITNRGFRDVLELRRLDWPGYKLHWTPPAPLVPRQLRREVSGRVLADGTVREPLSEDEVRQELAFLQEEGVASVAICLLHAYAYPEHELQVARIAAAEFPTLSITLSHQVTREYREYERTSTAVADAAIKRRMARYIDNLKDRLTQEGFKGSFVLTRCDGGVMSAEEAREKPIRTLISGPASGAMGVVTMSRWLGLPNLIGCDMGGTSFDASLVIDHEPRLANETEIGSVPLLVPVIELATIGAGGGSIARLDVGGALEVGPQSAGSTPGPVCYGRGGTEPTFTDAALVSGLLDPARFMGGSMPLDLQAARRAISERIGDPLGLGLEEAAAGIVALSEAKMAAMLEELTVQKGRDPRDFTLFPFGGGGSLVASALASRLGIPRFIVPKWPGTFSAWGMLTLDIVHDFARTLIVPLAELTPELLRDAFDELRDRARQALQREHVADENRTLIFSIDMRYDSQEHVLTLPFDPAFLEPGGTDRMRGMFQARHQQAYGFSTDDSIQITTYRVRAVGSLPKPQPVHEEATPTGASHALRSRRRATHRESGGRLDWAIYDRDLLVPGNRLHGPALIEERAATTLVAPGQQLDVDGLGNLVVTPEKEQPA